MSPVATAGIALTAVTLVGLLVAERRGSPRWRAITKLLASTGFILCALGVGATESTYGLLILGALGLSWVGDALLLSDREGIFLGGLVAFLLAHVAYCAAFWSLGVNLTWVGAGAVGLGVIAALVLRWLLPHLQGTMRVAVLAYVAVIATMVALALGTLGAGGSSILAVGAVLFFLSDLAVARHRFVTPGFSNKAWGLPLYYGGQVLLALTAGL